MNNKDIEKCKEQSLQTANIHNPSLGIRKLNITVIEYASCYPP